MATFQSIPGAWHEEPEAYPPLRPRVDLKALLPIYARSKFESMTTITNILSAIPMHEARFLESLSRLAELLTVGLGMEDGETHELVTKFVGLWDDNFRHAYDDLGVDLDYVRCLTEGLAVGDYIERCSEEKDWAIDNVPPTIHHTPRIDPVAWIVSNTELPIAVAYVFACMCDPAFDTNGAYRNWLEDLLAQQPIYIDRPSNLDQLLHDRAEKGLQYGPFEPLLQKCFKHGSGANGILAMFTWLMAPAVGDIIDRGVDTVSQHLEREYVQKTAVEIYNPLSFGLLETRCAIAASNMNLRGLIHLFAYDAVMLRRDGTPPDEVMWHIHRALVRCAMNVDRSEAAQNQLETFATDAEKRILDLEREGVDVVERDWDPYKEDDDDPWPVIEPALLEDVEFEAVGEELNVKDYTVLAYYDEGQTCKVCYEPLTHFNLGLPMRPKCCNHVSHEGCLQTLINRVESYANKCPECRAVMCPPRERRLKVVDDDEQMPDDDPDGEEQ